MNFHLSKLLLAVLIPATLVLAEPLGEVRYQLMQLGAGAAVLTVEAPPERISVALSQDRGSLRVHLSDGVFVESENGDYKPSGIVQKIEQLRGRLGVELVLTLQRNAEVQALKGSKGMRLMILAPELESQSKQPDVDAPISPSSEVSKVECESSARKDQEKIEELRGLVRELTLELVKLKSGLQDKCVATTATR